MEKIENLNPELTAFWDARMHLEKMRTDSNYSQDDIDKQHDKCVYLAIGYTIALEKKPNK